MDCRALGYVAIETPAVDEWATYLTDVMGLMESRELFRRDPDARYFRMDQRAYRFSLKAAPTESYTVGWELPSRAAMAVALDELRAAGVAVKECAPEEAAARGVSGLLRLDDPFGNPIELFWGHETSETPFDSPTGVGFPAGATGIGHVLYAVPECAPAMDFYCGVLGFEPTDYYDWGPKSAWFARCNSRHHTVAFLDVDLPGGPGINHVMVEMESLIDVGRTLDRATDAGVEMVMSLGQHSNDQAVSFYMRSPGRTNFEMGCDQLRIEDDSTWQVIAWSGGGDMWGHRGVMMDDISAGRD